MYIFLDTETHAAEDPILIQLAYKLSDGEGYFTSMYATGGTPIDFGAMAVHHITEKHLADKQIFNGSLDQNVLRGYLENYTLVAHNAAFDVGVLENHDLEVPNPICTLRLSRHLYPELDSHKQQYLRYYFGFDMYGEDVVAHDALGDVKVLEKIFEKMKTDLAEKENISDEEELKQRMIDISSRPSVLYMCKFGKHKGTLWSEVPQDYLSWIVNISDFTDEDVIYTAQYYLES